MFEKMIGKSGRYHPNETALSPAFQPRVPSPTCLIEGGSDAGEEFPVGVSVVVLDQVIDLASGAVGVALVLLSASRAGGASVDVCLHIFLRSKC